MTALSTSNSKTVSHSPIQSARRCYQQSGLQSLSFIRFYLCMFVKKKQSGEILEVSKLGSYLQTNSTVYTCSYIYTTHVYIYIQAHICVHMCVCGPVYIRIYGDQRSLLGDVLSSHPPGFLREGLIISLSDAHWLADQWALVFCLSLSLQHWDRKNTSRYLAFSHGFWMELRPSFFQASTSPT